MDDRSERTNTLLRRYVLDQYRDAHENQRGGTLALAGQRYTNHLAACPDAVVGDYDVSNGVYGCDTGCDYVRVEASISCPHGESDEWEAGEFGELSSVIKDLERDYPDEE